MATLTSTVIDRVLKKFQERGQVDVLTSGMDATQTSLEYQGFLPNWGPGTRIEIGSETMLVTSNDADNKTAIIVRGWLGTTADTHSSGDPIYINPRFYRSDIMELVNDCLGDLFGQHLYAVDADEFDYNAELIGYEIPTEAVEILRVDGLKDVAAKYWEPVHDWLEMDNANVADFSTGRAIMVRSALPADSSLRVVYSKPFTKVTQESDDLEAVAGLRPYMTDLPFYYAMTRMMADEERNRSSIDAAESHQRAQDTPPFLALRTAQWYQSRYNDRILVARAHQAQETQKSISTAYGS